MTLRHTCAIPPSTLQAMAKALIPSRDGYFGLKPYQKADSTGVKLIGSLAVGALRHLKDRRPSRSAENWLRTHGPYTFTALKDGSILPLNRYYKPLGLEESRVYFDYEDFAFQAIPPGVLRFEWVHTHYPERDDDGDAAYYLYNDRDAPWWGTDKLRAYAVRLLGLIGAVSKAP